MRAAWYEQRGPAPDVLVVGEMPDPEPGPGEVRIRVAVSGINPGDIKKREDFFATGMRFPRVIPHSDGAGLIDRVGENVAASRLGERVWCYGAQSGRPFGTSAEYVVVPTAQAVPLPERVSFEQGACLGIPGLTAHRAVYVAGPVAGQTVLVQGGAGAVGCCAVALASYARAHVIATVRSAADAEIAARAGAREVVRTDGRSREEVIDRLHHLAPEGVDHIIEVAFDANIEVDTAVLRQGGSIAAYATGVSTPAIPFWQLVFRNIRLYFLGSDDFSPEAKVEAASALNEVLRSSWPGYAIGQRFPLSSIIAAHESVEHRQVSGRVVVLIDR